MKKFPASQSMFLVRNAAMINGLAQDLNFS